MNKLNDSAYAPYSSGASHRANKIPSRKFEPEMSPLSRIASPPFVIQRKNLANANPFVGTDCASTESGVGSVKGLLLSSTTGSNTLVSDNVVNRWGGLKSEEGISRNT